MFGTLILIAEKYGRCNQNYGCDSNIKPLKYLYVSCKLQFKTIVITLIREDIFIYIRIIKLRH